MVFKNKKEGLESIVEDQKVIFKDSDADMIVGVKIFTSKELAVDAAKKFINV